MHLLKQRQSLSSSQVTPPAGSYPRLGVLLLPPWRSASPSQAYFKRFNRLPWQFAYKVPSYFWYICKALDSQI